MTTLNETIQPTAFELDEILQQATQGVSDDEFIDKYLSNLIKLLANNPKMYRAYGAWWYSLKKMIIEQKGYSGFGVNLGSSETDIYTYKKPVHTLLAAWIYMNSRVESGAQYSSYHLLPTYATASDESYQYELIDPDMEMLIELKTGAMIH